METIKMIQANGEINSLYYRPGPLGNILLVQTN
jgi:hypothetical protein